MALAMADVKELDSEDDEESAGDEDDADASAGNSKAANG